MSGYADAQAGRTENVWNKITEDLEWKRLRMSR